MDWMHSTFGTDWKCSAGWILSVHLHMLFWFAHNVIGVFVPCLSDIVQEISMCQQQIPDSTYQIRLNVTEGEIYVLGTYELKVIFFLWLCVQTRAMASSFLRFLDHTQRRITVGRIPLDLWSARRRVLYLTTHNIPNRQTSRPPVEFELTISEGESLQTYALQRAATGTGTVNSTVLQLLTGDCNNRTVMYLLRNGGKGEYMYYCDKRSTWNIVANAVLIWVRKVQLRYEATLLGT